MSSACYIRLMSANASMSPNRPENPKLFIWMQIHRKLVGVCGIFLVILVTALSVRFAFLTGPLGIALTAAALVMALMIFVAQAVDAEQKHSTVERRFDELEENIPAAVSDSQPTAAAKEYDAYERATEEFQKHALSLASAPVDFTGPDGVPLEVLADVVNHWRNEGEKGRWTTGDLIGVARRQGRGNFPWFVGFKPDGGTAQWLQVSKGGRGKTEATVQEVPRDSPNPR